jgi:tetratricopeptide (TPR) repeat protein
MEVLFYLLQQARSAERYEVVDSTLSRIFEEASAAGFYPVIGTNYMAHDPDRALSYAQAAMEEEPDSAALQLQAHRAYLIAGDYDRARELYERMSEGRVPEPILLGAEVRQACADGRVAEGRAIARHLLADEAQPLVVRWSSAVTAGLTKEATELLEPLNKNETLIILSQYLIYSEFDARQYPLLHAGLRRAGLERPQATRPAYACPIDAAD